MSKRILVLIAGAATLVGCTGSGSTIAAGDDPAAGRTAVAADTTSPTTSPAPAPVAAAPLPAPSSPAAAPVATAPPTPPATTPTAQAATTPAAPAATAPAAAPSPPVATAPPTTAPAPAVLEVGVVHPWVGYSQTRLRALGYGDLEVDQRFGPATRAAVVQFEQVNRTEVDGRLEADERLLLLSNAALANTAVAQPISGSVAPAQAPAKLVPPTTAPPPAPTPPPAGGFATPATARGNANCQAIAAEFVRQGATLPVAEEFAYVIAPRESGCVPQEVNNSTDLSYSRIGLNFKGNMPRYWGNLCGVTDYRLTADLVLDVKCGLAAYNALGWKPWAVG